MACLLRAPDSSSGGVVVVTTPERDRAIQPDPAVRETIRELKRRGWAVGLHHNWHDHDFRHDPLFDFHMAGEGDLRARTGGDIPLLPMDACNFVPDFFRPGAGEKFWDVLYVARAVFFKRIPEFYQAIREVYDHGHPLRVLFLCPVPPRTAGSGASELHGIRDLYDSLFTEAEKDRFTLLTMDYRYPFPLDLETLAYFYRSSRVFVHTADDERRCRVAAYAWAAGLPVVARESVASLLPAELQGEPFFYRVDHDEDFPAQIVRAVAAAAPWPAQEPATHLSSRFTVDQLGAELARLCGGPASDYAPERLAAANLDIRLGRHHGLGEGPNFLPMPLGSFLSLVLREPDTAREVAAGFPDPEGELARRYAGSAAPARVVAAPAPTLLKRIAGSLGLR
jgi:glycosyltransferase involved in cell wall biosynthesis